ncbi:SRPBCC family protein [Psychrobium sp. nBUS_13]|uniref:SRPBCC family protein n=1 Tax=Psychrobium sp. nBUS_13 TaxID=3395319 RepID=UPI003EBD1341
MPQVNRSALVMFSAQQMYDLVNDVAAYPQFLPGCVGSRIVSDEESVMVASVDVSKAGIKKTFTTRNTLTENERVDMALVDGPFRLLTGGWSFLALDDNACKVNLDLEFEFDNKLAEFAFGKVFKELVGNMVTAFSERAKVVYE